MWVCIRGGEGTGETVELTGKMIELGGERGGYCGGDSFVLVLDYGLGRYSLLVY